MDIVGNISSLYDGSVNFLMKPVREDIPVWQIALGLLVLFVLAFWVIDNVSLITKALKKGAESVVEGV